MFDEEDENLKEKFRQSYMEQMESLREGDRMSPWLRALLWLVVIMIVMVLALAR